MPCLAVKLISNFESSISNSSIVDSTIFLGKNASTLGGLTEWIRYHPEALVLIERVPIIPLMFSDVMALRIIKDGTSPFNLKDISLVFSLMV